MSTKQRPTPPAGDGGKRNEPGDERAETTKPAEAADKPEFPGVRSVVAFVRRHPVVTVLGAAGVGLFGGIEIATAMLVGAGVAAVVARGGGQPHVVRVRARGILARHPEIQNRARAIVNAVRGKPNGHSEPRG